MPDLPQAPANFPANRWQRLRSGAFGMRYVLSSSDASRQAGVISLLAVAETLFAVALYWAVAVYWDTHQPLVVSLYVVPFLLLRSPASIRLGVEGFLRDHFDFVDWGQFSTRRRAAWLTLFALLGGAAAYLLMAPWALPALAGLSGDTLFWHAALWGAAAAGIGLLVAVAVTGTVAGTVVVAVAGAGAGAGAVAGAVAGAGFALRGLFFRITATLRCLPEGLRQLPANWFESTLVIDARTEVELLPGIRPHADFLSLSGLLRQAMRERSNIDRFLIYPLLFLFLFVPALFYRLYIKATAWAYCLLAFLLWRRPQDEGRKAWLKSPWANEARRWALIVLSVLGLIQVLIYAGLGPESWKLVGDWAEPLVSHFWLVAISQQAPWLLLFFLNFAACVWLLGWSSHFGQQFADDEHYQPWSINLWLFSLASRLHTLSIVLIILCVVLIFTLIYAPQMLEWLPPRQLDGLRQGLGLR